MTTNIQRYLMVAGIAIVTILVGCKEKDDPTPDTNTPTSDPSTQYNFSDAYGVLAAVKSISYQSFNGITIPVETNTATAAFPSAPGSSTFLEAGTVTINSRSLTRQSNNSYVFQDLTSPLNFGTEIVWNVSGSGGVLAFTESISEPIPSFNSYNKLPGSVNRADGLTLDFGSGAFSNADSVLVVVASGSGYIYKTIGANASTCSFSASELSTLSSSSTGMIQVSPRFVKSEDFSTDKNMYFVNQATYSKMNVAIN